MTCKTRLYTAPYVYCGRLQVGLQFTTVKFNWSEFRFYTNMIFLHTNSVIFLLWELHDMLKHVLKGVGRKLIIHAETWQCSSLGRNKNESRCNGRVNPERVLWQVGTRRPLSAWSWWVPCVTRVVGSGFGARRFYLTSLLWSVCVLQWCTEKLGCKMKVFVDLS